MKKIWQYTALFLFCATTLFAAEPLVSGTWLQKHLHDKGLILVDASDSTLYAKEHIPGSVNAPISLWREKHDGYLLVKDAEAIQKVMENLGIGKESHVVVYSHHANAKDILKATYLLWAMEYYGFTESSLLDGGLVAWKADGGVTATERVTPAKGDFKVAPNSAIVADRAYVQAHLGQSAMIDARPAIFYFGAQKQPVLKRAGHISTAKSYFWKYSFTGEMLKSKALLKEMLIDGMGLSPDKPVITYCTGGLETSMNFFVLHRVLGFENIRLYDASMKEWANLDDTPMTKYRWE